MKVSTAFRNAWKTYTASFGETLKFFLVEACLTLICLAPLLGLAGKAPAWIAWACPVLWIFVMLPARMNAACGMKRALRGGPLGGLELISPENYGGKLVCGLKRMLFLLLWGAPLIACAVIAWNNISGETDGFTLLRSIKTFGGGDTITGVVYLAGILAGAILLFVIGLGFHSGDRHAMVLGGRKLGNRRFRILGCWLCSLVIFLPLIAAVADTVLRYLPVIRNLDGLLMGMTELPSTRTTVIILAAGVLLTIPLIPLRSLVVAAYVKGIQGKPDEDKA